MKKKNIFIHISMWLCVLIIVLSSRYWHNLVKQEIIDYISQQTIVKETEKEPEAITVFVEREQMNSNNYSSIKLDVNNIDQNPELPTGCEVTSLTIVLNYLGYDVDKLTMADLFLPQGEIGKTDPDVAFIGNPRDKHSYGANAPVLAQTANDYLTKMKSDYHAYNMTGKDFSELERYILDGYPVMVWETINMLESYPSSKWTIDNKEIQWYANFHCMVLIGWTEDTYIMSDPLKGIVEYDKDIVLQRYNELGKQAIVIY